MFLIVRKLPNGPIETFQYAFQEKQDAIDLINAFGFADWDDDKNCAMFADGSFYQIQEHDDVTRASVH